MAMLKINVENDWESKAEFSELKAMELFYTDWGSKDCFMKLNCDLTEGDVSYNVVSLISGKLYGFVSSSEVYRFKSAVLNLEK